MSLLSTQQPFHHHLPRMGVHKTAAYFRLIQEFRKLEREPVEYITAHPNEDNVLTWYYIIEGPPDTPYEGGEYFGKLQFPPDYPFNPPAISMITPSGRFEPSTELCLSMSSFHPESWSPSWSVGTILLGVLSFMVGEDHTTGAIHPTKTSDADKRAYAASSKEFNRDNKIFIEQFPELADPDAYRDL